MGLRLEPSIPEQRNSSPRPIDAPICRLTGRIRLVALLHKGRRFSEELLQRLEHAGLHGVPAMPRDEGELQRGKRLPRGQPVGSHNAHPAAPSLSVSSADASPALS